MSVQVNIPMSKGFLYVVFGEEYLTPFKTSAKYLKKVSKLPLAVITNLKTLTKKDVPEVDIVRYVDLDTNRNRVIRTKAIDYTPFDQTLMTDADSIPISRSVDSLFQNLNTHDFGFQLVKEYTDMIPRIYGHAIYKTRITTPLVVYSGGIILFNKNEKCERFFTTWHNYWKLTGEGRDMPALTCAIKNSDINFFLVDHCIDREIGPNTKIFHAYGDHDKTIIPTFNKNKPFDNRRDLWELIPIQPNTILEHDPLEHDEDEL